MRILIAYKFFFPYDGGERRLFACESCCSRGAGAAPFRQRISQAILPPKHQERAASNHLTNQSRTGW